MKQSLNKYDIEVDNFPAKRLSSTYFKDSDVIECRKIEDAPISINMSEIRELMLECSKWLRSSEKWSWSASWGISKSKSFNEKKRSSSKPRNLDLNETKKKQVPNTYETYAYDTVIRKKSISPLWTTSS